MNKVFKALIIILSIVVVNVFLWINRFPNLHGNDVDKITISDSKGMVLFREDKKTKNAMQQY
ncbi:hypothetical protein QFZ77_007417 [Paenibacillus sp. V4I3]|uniref:hypothetical protein n=1 Tax=unclassified Paenibacillus TaxID=185978 RepID=UPI0027847DFD|nr:MULTISPECIES: hypothetical protein [unclassified Paenibacillus]MDQ0878758.1 hypothetical protein [Paenibacillus sp. V4I3]MDQ0885389.1 hypothetical protein [Paenibacillus sp. V4I9]